jgi:hypothetical protein
MSHASLIPNIPNKNNYLLYRDPCLILFHSGQNGGTRITVSSPDISRIAVGRPWRRVYHRATAEGWIRGVLEQYVAGSDTRGRPEGRSYPRSQQAIREISGLASVGR